MCSLTPEIIDKLKKPFAPEQHQDRKLKGGGTWFFIPWQLIRDRLQEVDPNYKQEFGSAQYLGDYCIVSCTLTICGVSRQALGNAELVILSDKGNNMARGTPIERAIADAFKNAAESFGVAAYLDDQEAVIRIMSKAGDSRAYKYAKNQQQAEAGLPPIHGKSKPKNDPPAGWNPAY